MSFKLIDLGSEGYEFDANVWNWKAALEVIKSLDLISEGKIRQMSVNATGIKVDIDDAHFIGEKLRNVILPKLAPNKRIFTDLTITEAADDMTLFKDDDEQWKNYSVNYEWVKEFSDFCIKSKGFQVY